VKIIIVSGAETVFELSNPTSLTTRDPKSDHKDSFPYFESNNSSFIVEDSYQLASS
jgi:hypothetical protein